MLLNKCYSKLLLTICGVSLSVIAASAQSPNLQATVEQNDRLPLQSSTQQTDRMPFQGKATQTDQSPLQLQADKNKLEGSIQQGNKLSPWYGTSPDQLQEQMPKPAPPRLSNIMPATPYYGDPNQIEHKEPIPENPQLVWQLNDLVGQYYGQGVNAQISGHSGIKPTHLTAVGHVIQMNGSNPNLPPLWKNWYQNFMHMVYSNLQHLPGRNAERVFVWIRSDGAIKINRVGAGNSLYTAIMSLQGMPEIKFEPVDGCDTVMLNLYAYKGDPVIRDDVWGRATGVSSIKGVW
jgi:hypothetical protein